MIQRIIDIYIDAISWAVQCAPDEILSEDSSQRYFRNTKHHAHL